jgi:hypothetical protein
MSNQDLFFPAGHSGICMPVVSATLEGKAKQSLKPQEFKASFGNTGIPHKKRGGRGGRKKTFFSFKLPLKFTLTH